MYKRKGKWLFCGGTLTRGWQYNFMLDKQYSMSGRTRLYLSLSFFIWYLEVHYDLKTRESSEEITEILRNSLGKISNGTNTRR